MTSQNESSWYQSVLPKAAIGRKKGGRTHFRAISAGNVLYYPSSTQAQMARSMAGKQPIRNQLLLALSFDLF